MNETLIPQANELREELGNPFWSYPTPYHVALSQVDQFCATHVLTWEETRTIQRYYGDKLTWAIRHLKLTEAARRIRETIGQPMIPL